MAEGRAPSDTAASAEPDLLQPTNEREKEALDSVTIINDREWVNHCNQKGVYLFLEKQ